VQENIPPEKLKENLLELTELVAHDYQQYAKGFPGVEITQTLEKREIDKILQNLISENKHLAIDIGCATGERTRYMKEY
jgi:hypothetical protein